MSITIPAEYAADFRAAIVEEIAIGTRFVKQNHVEVAQALERDDPAEGALADLDGTMGLLAADAALLAQVGPSGTDTLDVHTDPSTLSSVFEAMVRDVVGPRLADLIDTCPLDWPLREQVIVQLERFEWALEHAGDFNAKAVAAMHAAHEKEEKRN